MTALAPPPLALLAELTHRCPLRCGYCSNPLELSARSAELGTATWLKVLEEAAALGVLHVHFSGGEPALRADLEPLVERAHAVGLYTNLITSGVRLTRERLQVLAQGGLDHVQLSLQDSEAGPADETSGLRGAHAHKLAVAGWVRAAGLPLTVNAVVHRRNLERLEAIIALAVELGAQRLEVAHTQYHGWARQNLAALLPDEAALERATAQVEAARARLRGRMRIDYVIPDLHADLPKPCMDGWGRRFLGVTPEGWVLPCQGAQGIPGLQFERAGERPLAEIWQHSQAFQRFRGTAWMPEPCRSCERRELDWGGCRCQALAFTGDASATDPVCEKSPHHAALRALARSAAAVPADAPDARYRYRGGAAGAPARSAASASAAAPREPGSAALAPADTEPRA